MHKKYKECDEYACVCGLRWGLKEKDPHKERIQAIIEKIRRSLNRK